MGGWYTAVPITKRLSRFLNVRLENVTRALVFFLLDVAPSAEFTKLISIEHFVNEEL